MSRDDEPLLLPLEESAAGVPTGAESRLAAALLVQAQALQSVHRSQAELVQRIETGASEAAMGVALASMREALDAVDRAREDVVDQVLHQRRRHALLLGLALVLALAGTATALWAVLDVRGSLPDRFADLQTAIVEQAESTPGPEAFDAAVQAALDGRVARLEQESAVVRAERDDARGQLAALGSESESIALQLDSARDEADSLRAELASIQADSESLGGELEQARADRLQQIGESARLLEQVLAKERRIEELGEALAALRERPEEPPAAIVTTHLDGLGGLAGQVSAAIRLSGARDVRVVEVGHIADGDLHDVLVLHLGPDGRPGRLVQAARATIRSDGGIALLELVDAVDQDGLPTGPESIGLPDLDVPVWSSLGVDVPGDYVPLGVVTDALSALVGIVGLRVESLGGFDGERLSGLVLVEDDDRGVTVRTLSAADAVVSPVGPELQLRDGSVFEAGAHRPFYQGLYRVPLPGADYGAWLATAGGPR